MIYEGPGVTVESGRKEPLAKAQSRKVATKREEPRIGTQHGGRDRTDNA
jgi:hypothetical protein